MNGTTPSSAPNANDNHAATTGGVVLRVTRDEPLSQSLPDADLSNVIPFARRRRSGEERETPLLAIDASLRVAPWWNPHGRIGFAVFLAVSVATHVGLFYFFNREPEPLASIGLQSISVELVLGDNKAAGLADRVSPDEAPTTSVGQPEEK